MVSESSSNGSKAGLVIANKYKLIKKIGAGSFGEIYTASTEGSAEQVAVKLEKTNCDHPQLYFESKMYKHLNTGDGTPKCKYYGVAKEWNCLVVELLGPSLEDLFSYCGRRFTLKTTLMLADQLVQRVEYIHSRHYLHRDIKPDNFLMGVGRNSNKVYMIDYGLAKKFKDSKKGTHIPYREDRDLIGTARYASTNAHVGREQGRRDDLEAIGYVLLYFCKGKLPWQGLKTNNKDQKYEKIAEKKLNTSVAELCKGQPSEFGQYLNYVKGLKFEEAPDYSFLRQLFRLLFRTSEYQYDYAFDWSTLRQQDQSEFMKSKKKSKTATLKQL